MSEGEEDRIAVFVFRDAGLLDELVDEIGLVVSDRSDFEGLAPAKFMTLATVRKGF